MKRLLPVLMAIFLSACAGSGTRDLAGIQSVVASADANSVVISRNTGFVGLVPRINIKLDGERAAALGNEEVVSFRVTPGEHTLEAQFEGASSIGVKKGVATFVNDGTSPQFFTISLKSGLIGAELILIQVTADSFGATTR